MSRHLAVPPATLKRWRQERSGPPYFRLGNQVRYSVAEVEAWLQTRHHAG